MTAQAGTREAPGFVPARDTTRNFTAALGRFATGVTIVTAQTPAGWSAITANSFASLSLDPRLLLTWPAKPSRRFAVFIRAGALRSMCGALTTARCAARSPGNIGPATGILRS